jgi:hypothetical protein
MVSTDVYLRWCCRLNTIPTGPAELYLDYGDFDLKITAPVNHIVVSSGELQKNPAEVYTAADLKDGN